MLTYYIATDGDDGNPGTIDDPFATLEAARDAIRAELAGDGLPAGGATVYLREGTYWRTAIFELTSADASTADKPITYMAYPGETARISGGEIISGSWTDVGDGSYWISCAYDINSLWVDGARATRARLPQTGYFTIASVDEETKLTAFDFTEGDIDGNWHNLTDVEVVCIRKIEAGRYKIADVTDTTVTFNGSLSESWNRGYDWDYPPVTNTRYWCESVKEGLAPGSWYLDKVADKLYYYPLAGAAIGDSELILPRLTQLISATDAAHTRFESLTFSHTDWGMPLGYQIPYQAGAKIETDPAILFDGADYCQITECTLEHHGGWCVYLHGHGCAVDACTFQDLGAGAVRIASVASLGYLDDGLAHYCAVRNSTITHFGRVYLEAVGILVQLEGHATIYGNEISDGQYSGISVGWKWNNSSTGCYGNHIADNVIYDVMQKLNDGAGVYLLGNQPGTVVEGNYIHGVRYIEDEQHFQANRNVRGIYLDAGSSNMTIQHNLIADCEQGFIVSSYQTDAIELLSNLFVDCYQCVFYYYTGALAGHAKYNVVYCDQGPDGALFWPSTLQAGVWTEHDYNCYYQRTSGTGDWNLAEWQSWGYDANSIETDPLLCDYAAADYRLRHYSPALPPLGFNADWLIEPVEHSIHVSPYAVSMWQRLGQ